jgi:hypothetical protein
MTYRPLLVLLAVGAIPLSTGPSPPLPPGSVAQPEIAARFEAELARFPDLEYPGLARELGLKPAPRVALGFDVQKAQYFEHVAAALKLTAEEKARLAESGVVSVDHKQRYSMASAYFAIYARDLPVLVTVDSVLHALHRSYDDVLKTLEADVFAPTIDHVLAAVDEEIGRAAKTGPVPALRSTLEDVDLYATVARNLLAGAGAPQDEAAPDGPSVAVPVPPRLVSQASVETLLGKIQGLELESPDGPGTFLRGSPRAIDYSQFRPRGHYTATPQLRRYFRTMMWLGRSDLGFVLEHPHPGAAAGIDVGRELRGAAAFVILLERTGSLQRLQGISDVVDFLIGSADDVSIPDVTASLSAARVRRLEDLGEEKRLAALRAALAGTAGRRGHVRGQTVTSNVNSPEKSPPPKVFQLFGQRFGVDSFVLSQVVFDSIVFKGNKQKRMMPSGLDVMAAFGNDEAVPLLRTELETHHYAANLLAARRTVEGEKRESWNASAYGIWLDALRTLNDSRAPPKNLPRAMLTQAWRRKQLQTQLASWAELRHDTVLYLKQSYTSVPVCGYPAGFVEPYPQVYARLGFLARELSLRLAKVGGLYREFFDNFAARMADLERLARKELNAQPFTAEEAAFVKKTIDRRGQGSGPPRYDGWYASLFAGGDPEKWSPVVADVHTDPDSHEVLEEAVGDANFLVVAVDNENDHAVYVGPAYSYYEFRAPAERRMTDESWAQRILDDEAPPRPAWTASLQPPASARRLDHPPPRAAR